jgi:two-component system cell cycle sensor histidine kinase/response regulator CckA
LQAEITPITLPPPERGMLLRIAEVEPGMGEVQASAARLQAVGALAGGIAHDFNNLLTAIAASAEAVLARSAEEEARADLQQIMDSAGRGAALVRQLLAFARQQALQPRVVELNEAVTAVGAMLRRLLGRGVQLDFALEEPGRRERIDPTQLDQVIVNLALNARDAMPDGGRLRIATGHALVLRPEHAGTERLPPGRYAVLEVSDTGRGIPAEVLPRIFEPFFTTRRERGGTGLGLATVHGIVRQSGGFVAVESAEGRGTTFRIWLPRHDGPAEGAAAQGTACPVTAIPPRPCPVVAGTGGCTVSPAPGAAGEVLLVEDEAPLLRLAERALTRAGFRVRSAPSAEDALAMMEGAAEPAALVSDVVMPGLDGFDLAARLRARFPRLPVLLVSGYAESALGRDLEGEGLRLLPKPYRLEELVGALRRILPAEAEQVP